MAIKGFKGIGSDSPNNPLRPLSPHSGFPQQQPQQQQLLNLQTTSLLNGSMLQRALLLQQLQGMNPMLGPASGYPRCCPSQDTGAAGGESSQAAQLTAAVQLQRCPWPWCWCFGQCSVAAYTHIQIRCHLNAGCGGAHL